MDRRKFLKSSAAAIASLVLPRSKYVDISEIEAERDRLKTELAFYKDLAEKPKWVWVGTDPATGKDWVQEITFCGVLGGEDTYKVVSSDEPAWDRADIVADVIGWEADLKEDLSEVF